MTDASHIGAREPEETSKKNISLSPMPLSFCFSCMIGERGKAFVYIGGGICGLSAECRTQSAGCRINIKERVNE